MRVSPVVILLLSVSLSGCFRGSNVKGDFACKAPGGSCAPMSTIDREALAGIGGGISAAPLGVLRSPGSLPPLPSPTRTVSTAGPDGTVPARTTERVLRVVFPAHIDKDGIYREEAAAHAVVEPTTWAQALGAGGAAAEPRRVPGLRQGGIAPAVQPNVQLSAAASGSLLASMDEVVAAQAARRAGAVAAVAPAPAVAAAPSRPAVGATVSQFVAASRAPVPLNLAEAVAGLSAPPVARLDPAGPGNYDTPEVAAAAPASAAASASLSAASASKPSPGSVMRTARWRSQNYRIPVAAATAGPATATASGLTTAELNRRALAKAGTSSPALRTEEQQPSTAAPPSLPKAHPTPLPVSRPSAPATPAPTADASLARERVRIMAGPQLQSLAGQQDVADLAPAYTHAGTAPAVAEGAPRP